MIDRENTRRRVALFSPSLAGGGAERVLVNLADGMLGEDIDVDVVLASASGPFLSELPSEARVVDLKASRIATTVLPLARYLRNIRPDALLGFQDHTNVAAIAASVISRTQTPVFAGVHTTWTTILQSQRLQNHLLARIVRIAYRHAAGIVSVSDGAADAVVHCLGVDRSHVRTIYNPVIGTDLFSKAEGAISDPWFNVGQPPVVLGIGRLTKLKQFDTLIESFVRLRASCPARLLILGEGQERPALESLVKRLDLSEDVALPGFVANPYPYMRRASVFVLSSAWEGLPTVLIEALALGASIVSTDCPSGPSEILDNGRYGALVPVGDAEAMAQAMHKAITAKPIQRDPASWARFTVSAATAAYIETLLPSSSPRPSPKNAHGEYRSTIWN